MYRKTNIACRHPVPRVTIGPTLTTIYLADELPSTVKALNDGWLATYQISTVVVRAPHVAFPITHQTN
jgi:hypothetical protein